MPAVPGAPEPSAAMPITARALEEATRSLFGGGRRVVAWGSGNVFEYFNGLHPIAPAYIVDEDATRWGQSRHGIEIAPPERLRGELAGTFVIIYASAWPEIQRQIARSFGLRSLPASAVFADAKTRTRLAWSETVARRTAPRRVDCGSNAIVVQGRTLPAVTAQVLRITAALHPSDRIILSTWNDTPPDLLYEAAALADDVVVSAPPENPGIQDRNLQIVSTHNGIARAVMTGARRVLTTRTDLAVLAESVFDRAAWWLDRVRDGRAAQAGLFDRLVVPSSDTRRFLLYHPSTLVMLGDADDMLRYWSAPLDERSGPAAGAEWAGESYLGLQFCRSLGRAIAGTLEDSWAFYRDLFAVVDDDWFDLLWFTHLSIPDAALRAGVRQPVTQAFWERLHARDADVPRRHLAGAA